MGVGSMSFFALLASSFCKTFWKSNPHNSREILAHLYQSIRSRSHSGPKWAEST